MKGNNPAPAPKTAVAEPPGSSANPGRCRSVALTGWLLDLYADPQGELALWLLEQEQPGDGCPPSACPRQRLRLRQPFPVAFYAAGPSPRLRMLWRHLARSNPRLMAEGVLRLSRQERRDLFLPGPVTVLAVEVQKPGLLPELFRRAAAAFPDLTFYDADLPLSARHAAVYGTFPLARLQVGALIAPDGTATVQTLRVLDSPWELDPLPPPLRVMHLSPDCDPRRQAPAWLEVQMETLTGAAEGAPYAMEGRQRQAFRLSLHPQRALLIGLRALLQRYDPDLLLTGWGDTWLLPHLLALCKKLGLPLPLNRDDEQPVLRRPERSYQAYGQVIYRGQQVLLYGRWHIDRFNAMMYHDYALQGILESARLSTLPVQQAARLSPGAGISAMQIVTALRQGVMTPWRKQQAEMPKGALDLLLADQGGLVYQPIIGLHRDVAEIDFISMYPSIMRRFNISPETIGYEQQAGGVECTAGATDVAATALGAGAATDVAATAVGAAWVPELNLWVGCAPGLIPQTLAPLLEKRVALKQRIASLPAWHPRKKLYRAQAAAHKWLLVTCFGYLGYKNARFGRIEAHQAVTAYSRECLLRAKEAAEDLGYSVLHLYIDGLWVKRQAAAPEDAPSRGAGGAGPMQAAGFGAAGPAPAEAGTGSPPLTVAAVQPLLDEIARRTGLPIALEGVYRWVAFLPSRADARLPVANRYFGVFQDGSLKVRGLEARRGDTPPFIAAVQMGLLQRLAAATETGDIQAAVKTGASDPASSNDWLCANLAAQSHPAWPAILAFLRRELRRLRQRRIPLQQLLVAQKLSRPLEQYRSPSPAARAAAQLAAQGKSTRPGQTLRFLYLRGDPRKGEDIHAWDAPPAPPPERLDIERYTTLFLRACAAVLQPFGCTEAELRDLLLG